jgi:hypothetical protein
MRGKDIPFEEDSISVIEALIHQANLSDQSQGSVGSIPDIAENRVRRAVHPRNKCPSFRVHYRIVFEEVGIATDYLSKLPSVYQALRDSVKGKCLESHPSLR